MLGEWRDKRRIPNRSRQRPQWTRLYIEALEDRSVPSAALDLIGVTALRNDPDFAGIDGSGVTVAVIDTGVDFSHPDLAPAFVAAHDVITGQDVVSWTHHHGTHVAGIIGARDEEIGVAIDVGLISLKVFSHTENGEHYSDDLSIKSALQWVLDHRQQYNIVAVNMSLGGGLYISDDIWPVYRDLIEQLEQAGVTVVSAAGNSFGCSQAIYGPRLDSAAPGIISTLNVGAVWEGFEGFFFRWPCSEVDWSTGADRLTSFSQRPPIANNTIFAPGAEIMSTMPGVSTAELSGTSMASPMVAGAVALMQEAAFQFGGRYLRPDEIASIVISTADWIFDGDDELDNVMNTNTWFPRLNVYSAVREIERMFEAIAPIDPNGTIAGAYLGPVFPGLNYGVAGFDGLHYWVNGSIGTDGGIIPVGNKDVDIIRFEVWVAGDITIEVGTRADAPADFDSLLRLFAADGTELAFDDNSGDDGSFSQLTGSILPGVYYVGVSGYNNRNYNPHVGGSGVSGATGNYTLYFDYVNVDPNGVLPGAVHVEPWDQGNTLYFQEFLGADLGVRVVRSDVDLYRIVVPDSGRLLIDIDTPDAVGYADTFLRFFDAFGNQLFANDNDYAFNVNLVQTEFPDPNSPPWVYDFERGSYAGHISDSFLIVDFSVPGVFYVGVSEWFNQFYDPNTFAFRPTPDAGGTYELWVTFVNSDLNGSIPYAWDVVLPIEDQPGIIGFDSNVQVGTKDVDFVRIRSNQVAILEVDVDSFDPPGNPDSVDTVLTLWNSDGDLLAYVDDSYSPDPFLQYTIAANTDYFLAVSGFGNNSFDPFFLASGAPGDTGLYLLSARLRPLADVPLLSDDISSNSGVTVPPREQFVFGHIGSDGGFAIGGGIVNSRVLRFH